MHSWWEYTPVQPVWKTVWRLLKKLRRELPYDPATPLLGTPVKNAKTPMEMVTGVPSVHSSIIYKSQEKAATYASTAVGVDREDVVCTDVVEDYPVMGEKKKKEILPFLTTWMNPEGTMMSEINQKKKNRNSMTLLMWNLKQNKTKPPKPNLQIGSDQKGRRKG